MRLFVSVLPPAEALEHLSRAVEPLRTAAPPALRWVPVERWHLTLAFLGEVPDERLPALAQALGEAVLGVPPLDLHVAGGGHFDGRVLWVGLGGSVDALTAAARRIARAARAVRVPAERRPFRAHVTLARARGPAPLAPLAATLRDYAGPAWRVDRALLVRSYIGPAPRHEPLVELPFRGEA